jgi:hypothetical protein
MAGIPPADEGANMPVLAEKASRVEREHRTFSVDVNVIKNELRAAGKKLQEKQRHATANDRLRLAEELEILEDCHNRLGNIEWI